MSKGVFVKVGGQLRKVINVWTKQGGMLKERIMPKSIVNGVLKDFMSYFSENLYFSNSYAGTIYNVNYASRGFIWYRNLASIEGSFQQTRLTTDRDGNVYVYLTRSNGDMLYKIDKDGNILWEKPFSSGSYFDLVAGREHLYIFYRFGSSSYIRKFELETGDYISGTTTYQSSDYQKITLDESENVYISYEIANSKYIEKYNSDLSQRIFREGGYSARSRGGIVHLAPYIYVADETSIGRYNDKTGAYINGVNVTGAPYGLFVRNNRIIAITTSKTYVYNSALGLVSEYPHSSDRLGAAVLYNGNFVGNSGRTLYIFDLSTNDRKSLGTFGSSGQGTFASSAAPGLEAVNKDLY